MNAASPLDAAEVRRSLQRGAAAPADRRHRADAAAAAVPAGHAAGADRRAAGARGREPRGRRDAAAHGRACWRPGTGAARRRRRPSPRVAADLSRCDDRADAGALARRLNSEVSGARSLVMGTFRAVPRCRDLAARPRRRRRARERMLALDERWARAALLAGDRQERVALDARLPAGLGRPAAQCRGRRRSGCRPTSASSAASCCAPSRSASIVTLCVPAAGLPAGLVAVDAAGAQGQPADDPGAGAVLDLDPGARARPGSCCCSARAWSTRR